jgi:hypothetical protein
VRLFVADEDGLSELTRGHQQTVRIAAADLQQARRTRTRIRARADVDVILDVTFAIADDFRSAQDLLGGAHADAGRTVYYAGSVAGLVGLISDIASAGVADGVTLIPASPRQDVASVGRDVRGRLVRRNQPRAS